MTVQQQYADLSKQIQTAKAHNQWGLAKHLSKKREALKPALRAIHTPQQPLTSKYTQASPQANAQVALPERSFLTFDFYGIPGSQQAAVLVDHIFNQWLQYHQFKRTISPAKLHSYRRIVEGVMSNVLYASALKKGGVLLSREKAFLSANSRYRPTFFNEKLLTVLDDLHAMGMIDQHKGERWRKNFANHFGCKAHRPVMQRTALTSTQTLDGLRNTYHVLRSTDVLFLTNQQEVVILKKDESSALMEYADTEQTMKYRKQVQVINTMLEHAGSLLAPECEHLAQYDQRQRVLVRKFTYGSLESGGRLWGGFWMNLKKIERPHVLRINREKTVELDYHAVLLHLAYIVAEERPPHSHDLYAIPGLSHESRPGIKKFMGALLFKKNCKRHDFPPYADEINNEVLVCQTDKGWKS